MTRTFTYFVVAVSLAFGAGASAHHRFAEIYLEGREMTIEGEVVRIEYRDPHSFMHVMVQNRRSELERWIVEWRGAGQLRKQGVTPQTIKPGERLIILGSPGRIASDHRLRLRTILRPQDGWRWRDTVE